MSCNAAIYTAMTTPTSVAAGGTVPMGTVVRRFGNVCGEPTLSLNGNGITVADDGYYSVSASLTALPVAAGAITATLYKDGVPVPGAVATGTAAAAGNAVNLTVGPSIIRLCGCSCNSTLTVLLSAAATANNMAVTVERV